MHVIFYLYTDKQKLLTPQFFKEMRAYTDNIVIKVPLQIPAVEKNVAWIQIVLVRVFKWIYYTKFILIRCQREHFHTAMIKTAGSNEDMMSRTIIFSLNNAGFKDLVLWKNDSAACFTFPFT